MALPSIDLEMVYWRARRQALRIKGAWRDAVRRAHTAAQLYQLRRRAAQLHQLEPEETFAFRLMWAITIVGLCAVLAIEAVGDEKFWTLPQGVPERAVLREHRPGKDVTQGQAATERPAKQHKGEQG